MSIEAKQLLAMMVGLVDSDTVEMMEQIDDETFDIEHPLWKVMWDREREVMEALFPVQYKAMKAKLDA